MPDLNGYFLNPNGAYDSVSELKGATEQLRTLLETLAGNLQTYQGQVQGLTADAFDQAAIRWQHECDDINNRLDLAGSSLNSMVDNIVDGDQQLSKIF